MRCQVDSEPSPKSFSVHRFQLEASVGSNVNIGYNKLVCLKNMPFN